MRKNETPLTPVYRLIIGSIERYGINGAKNICLELSEFKNHLTSSDSIIDENKNDLSLINDAYRLVQMYAESEPEATQEYWKEIFDKIENQENQCENCFVCNNCKRYFWAELGELYFGIENIEKKEGKYFPIRKLPRHLQKFFDQTKSVSQLYFSHTIDLKSKKDDVLIVLKGMSSSTPSLLNSTYDTETYDGGGFFLKFRGYGIAVDPGYHFIHNLHHYGFSVADIDCVIVTHEHIDHNNDMRLLEDMRSVIYQDLQAGGKQELIWLMDKVSYTVAKIYQENETGFSADRNRLYYVNPVNGMLIDNCKERTVSEVIPENVDIQFFQNKHIQRKSDRHFMEHTFGCKFLFSGISGTRILAYTSDTTYYDKLVEQIGRCDILIANISGLYEDDFMLIKKKERHLGYYGCYQIIKNMQARYGSYPKTVLLSEFWNGLMDIRYNVTKQLKDDLKQIGIHEINILPAEEGMEVSLLEPKVKCTQCGKMVNNFCIQKPYGYYDEIRIVCKECYY